MAKKSKSKKAQKERRQYILRRVLCLFVPWAAAAGLYFRAKHSVKFADFYADHIYPVWVGTIGRVLGWIPFSIEELGMYLLTAALLIRVIAGLIRVIAKKVTFRAAFLDLLYRLGVLLGSLALCFMLLGGVNYNRSTFAEASELQVVEPERDDLVRFLQVAAEKLNDLAPEVEDDGFGHAARRKDALKQGVEAMERLGKELPALSGFYPKAKRFFWTDFLSYQQVSGMYSPFTVEANVNGAIPGYEYPFTICHELSHLKGFMREDEANFIAFLACTGAEDVQFRYSGWVLAFIYVGNDLAKYDADTYWEIRDGLDEQVKRDLRYGGEFWAQYEGKISEAQTEMNDAYLKINNQTAGVESYDRVVKLMISYLFYK